MKRSFTLFLILFLLQAVAFAQPLNVVDGFLRDGNQNVIANQKIEIQFKTCGSNAFTTDTTFTNVDGYYRHEWFECIDATIEISTVCHGVNLMRSHTFATTGNGSVASVDLVCSQPVHCEADFSYQAKFDEQGNYQGLYELNAIIPYGSSVVDWYVNGNSIGNAMTAYYQTSAAGSVSVCLIVRDANQETCERCRDMVIEEVPRPCVDAARVNYDMNCPDEEQPVCGCDGVTYVNACVAEFYHGVNAWTAGPCQGRICDIDFTYRRAADAAGTITSAFEFEVLNSSGVDYQYQWAYGDFTSGDGRLTTHEYEGPGVYPVCVRAYDANQTLICEICRDIAIGDTSPPPCFDASRIDTLHNCPDEYAPVCGCDGVTYHNACIAEHHHGIVAWTAGACANTDCWVDFSYYRETNSDGTLSKRVRFDAYVDSLNGPWAFNWNFGDGASAIMQHPTHEFAANGSYRVCLEIANGEGNSCEICHDVVIDEAPHCGVEFTHFREMNADGTPSNRIKFEAYGDPATVYTYNWTLGDGNSSGGQQYVHEYPGPGRYRVCLLAYDSSGNQCEVCREVVIEADNCGVDFTHFREIRADGTLSDYVDFEVHHADNMDLIYAWDFGDNEAPAYERNVSRQYAAAGTYRICLDVYSATEEFLCQICRDVVIDEAPPACYDPQLVNDAANCPEVYQPVCGCDGITYENACMAQAAGNTRWTEGVCPNERCEVYFEFEKIQDANAPWRMRYKAYNGRDAVFTYKWRFGNGVLAEGEEVFHDYLNSGSYTVCVEAYVGDEFICIECREIVVNTDSAGDCIDFSRVDNTVVCTEEYQPVCGCDRVTYANACIAENVYGVTSWIDGECGDQSQCDFDFEFFNEPNSDGTASNKIKVVAQSDLAGGEWIYRWSFGDGIFGAGVEDSREYVNGGTYTICLDIYDPETYLCTVCKDIIVGTETELCYNDQLINNDASCTEEYAPVCGCDGVTYENACIAESRYGISRWEEGACDQRGCQLAFAYYPDTTNTDSLLYLFDAWTLDGHANEYDYIWTFGDSRTADGQNINRVFEAEGEYVVCVEAWRDGEYVCSWCQDVVIYDEEPGTTVDGDCRLAFGYYPNGMTSTGEMNYKFDAWTLDGRSEAYIYQWSFGDGSEDEGQSVDHGYAAGDVYYVCVEAWEGDKFICSWCDEVRIGDEQDNECQLGFEIYRDDSDAQDAFEWYKFEAYLPGSVGADQYEFKWTLGDGRFAYGPAIRHNFTDGGVYEVCLEAYRNDELVCTWCDKVLIDDTPDQGCQLAFDYEPNGERNAADVPVMDFKAWTLDGYDADYDYRWEFGDGRGAAGQRVTHDFKEPGVYKVCVGAFTGEYYVCHWCTEVEVEAVPNEGCQLAFSYAPDYSTTDDLNWYDFKAWTLDGNADNYTYKWDFGDDQTSAGQTARNGFTDPGAYKVCVDAYDGERFVCSWCSEVRVEEELQDEDCQIAFAYYEEEPMEGRQRFKFELESLSDNEEGYTYKWSFDNGESAEGRTATTAYTEEGIYTVCVDAYLGDEYVCGWCERIKVEEIPEWLPCDLDVAFEKDELSVWLKVREDYAKYYWDFGDGTTANERSVTHTYAEPGSYFICLEVVDRIGEHCSRCEMVTVRKEEEPYVDPCIDTDKIDYDVACTTDVKPVCGCDNVTYKNSCVAENYYGIKEWVEGPCERDEPGDELVICETDFKYSAFKVSDTRYLFEFHADETPDAIFFWDFGDGSEPSVEQSPTHYYDLPEAGDAAITACLYVIKRNEDAADDEPSYCLASYCETLAIDDARDAFIEGTITSGGEGFRRKIERRSGGGEPLADVKVLLLDVFGQVIRHDLTDDNGQYHFEELLFGDYSVKVEIDGIDHEPVPVQLDPLHQDEEDLDFEVTEEAISTGIEEQAFAKSINLFPNPTTGSIQLAFDLQEATNLQIKVTNLFGQTLQLREADFTVGAQQVELNLSEYAAGIYMITISTPTESFSRRVVRQE